MKINPSNAGSKLGNWIRKARRELKLTPSFVANEIKLAHSAYAEVELGIVKWIDSLRVTLLSQVLQLKTEAAKTLRSMVEAASKATPVKFEQIFTREDLKPVRLRTLDSFRAPKEKESEKLLDAVFQPLA
jgi:hypothetical protein